MTAEISQDPWATLDDLLGVEVAEATDTGLGAVAFYGRCSTEDNQDPETSYGWQLSNARKFVEPLGGNVVTEFFDVGQSRSVPWERREEAGRLLTALKDPDRGWDAVVVGEGTRCWFGNQFSLIAPKFAAYGVDLWVPELGGKFDSHNPSHKMLMSVLGGMSESERQHIQTRVRAAMDAQVLNDGRHQGGRAPYGYVAVDGGSHPNPRKESEGYRLRMLDVDESAAEMVRRIFTEYLTGKGDRAIANGLNRDGLPCPSAQRPRQNRHRFADGWQGSTVRAILDNPRYTGYAFFGRWSRHETLIDPDDVAAGHVTRFRRSNPDRWSALGNRPTRPSSPWRTSPRHSCCARPCGRRTAHRPQGRAQRTPHQADATVPRPTPVHAVRPQDGGQSPQARDVLPVPGPHARPELPRPGVPPLGGLSPRGRDLQGDQRVARRAVPPGQRRADRGGPGCLTGPVQRLQQPRGREEAHHRRRDTAPPVPGRHRSGSRPGSTDREDERSSGGAGSGEGRI